MANMFQNLFGGQKPPASPTPAAADDGFADFAGAPHPAPASIVAESISSSVSSSEGTFPTSAYPPRPYTKWYRVWERTTLADFYAELFILPLIIVIILVHVWGTRSNKRKASAWLNVHAPLLENEYALVGFGGRRAPSSREVEAMGAPKAEGSDRLIVPEEMLREESVNEFVTYATGRQNVAFTDVRLVLAKRHNPLLMLGEAVAGLLLDSMAPEKERMEITAYPFDGRENNLVPQKIREAEGGKKGAGKSEYDGFVWAVVNKDVMRRVRDERYDLSLTSTKDHSKLPPWCTVMSENAEITEKMLTPELVKAIEQCEGALDMLVVTDQPVDKPKTLDETVPKKRMSLTVRLPSGTDSTESYESTLPLFSYFLRLPDFLVSNAHFRPEVIRRIKATREDEIARLRKIDDDEKAEERKAKQDKRKKEEREQALKSMSSEEQRKFLEKEREREQRRGMKKRTMKA